MANSDNIKEKAIKRVKEKKDFYNHLISFVSTMAFMLVINLMTSPGYLWVTWLLIGWGIGLVSHYFSVFGFFGMGTEDWEDREVQREISKIRSREFPQTEDEDVLDLDRESLELEEREKLERKWDDRDLV